MKKFALICFLFLAACHAPQGNVNHLMGKWIGPEGTYIVLSKNGEGYEINIQSLDYLKSYDGKLVDGKIEFIRDGKTEKIVTGNGEATGMKWLADKQSCLIIQKGEGFCRN